MGSVGKTVGYGYNSAGQLTSMTLPSGQVVTYGYQNNRIANITLGSTVLLDDVEYEPFGPVRGWSWGNSALATREYDLDGLTSEIESAGARTYEYDDAFRVTEIEDLDEASLTWGYGYDSLDRLTSASKTGLSQTWTYDANGNRLTQGGTASSTFTIATTSNRLSSVSGAISRTYSYDAAGHTTGYSGMTFGYSDAGRLTSVSGTATASHVHNAMGERVKKVTGGATTYFVFDEAGHLIGEYDGSGNLVQETVWLHDIPVATLRPNGSAVDIYYVHTDHLNTPRRITRPSDDAIVWSWDSDPFGTTAADEDPDGDETDFVYHLRFPGQYLDEETGLHYNYFRDYDPVTGRYVESDPIGLAGGINTYAYTNGNPLRYTDPDGLLAIGDWREFVGGGLDFLKNYWDMRQANWIGADRYFHCKANCEAAQRGSGGEALACIVSDTREWWDLNVKGYPAVDSAGDQAANLFGRTVGTAGPVGTCWALCSIYRPIGLPAQY
jgi:RHS repeat-associated protein